MTMRTVVVGPVPDELAVLLDPLARAAGLVGSGPFNLGHPDDYRVPDRGLHRTRPSATWVTSAALVVEIVSPEDEAWAKLPFYAVHEVDELLIADPHTRTLRWLDRSDGTYDEVEVSDLLGVDVEAFAEQIDWPPVESR